MRRHVDEQLRRAQSAPRMSVSSRRHSSTKRLRPHHVDVGERAAGERRKAEAEDRADIGLAHVGEHALLDAARGLERLDGEQPLLDLVLVDAVGIELLRLQLGEARPQAASGRSADSRKSPCRSCGRAGRASPPSPPAASSAADRPPRRRDRPRSPCKIFQARSTATSSLSDERADRHAGHAAEILDHRGRHAFGQHQVAFAQIGADHARGVEAARIVDHDRGLADRAHIVERDARAPRRRSPCPG